MMMKGQSRRHKSAVSSQTQPGGILRHRSSATSSTATGSASGYNRSSHNTVDTAYYDAPDGMLRNSNSSFHEDSSRCYDHLHFNSSAPNLGSNNNNDFELIRDPIELADRIIKFNNSYASSSKMTLNYDGKGHQSTTTPPSSKSPSAPGLMMHRSRSDLKTPSLQDLDRRQQQRHTSELSWGNAAEEEYLGSMAGIDLDKSGCYGYGRGFASTSTSEHCPDGLRSSEAVNTSSLFTPPINTYQSLGRSSTLSYADDTPLLSQDCVEGRCKLHPEYELSDQKLPRGYSCPMCFAMSHYNPKLRDRNQDCHSGTASTENSSASSKNIDHNSYIQSKMGRSKSANQMPIDPGLYEGDDYYDTSMRGRDRTRRMNDDSNAVYPKSFSSTMSPRSRERGMGRSKSANRTPVNPNLVEDDDIDTSKIGPVGRARSVEQQRYPGDDGDRQRRSRTRSPHAKNKDVDGNRSRSRGKGLANALGNIREKLASHKSSSGSTSTRHRSRSRSRSGRTKKQLSDKEQSMVETTSLHAIDKGKRGRSRDKTSSSHSGRPNQESDFNNPFAPSKVNFDKKTGRCKKHPSVVLAKKSKFRSGSWEIIKQNGCPLCAKAGGGAHLRDEIGQDLDEDTKRKMDMLLRGGQDMSGDVSVSPSKKTEVRPRRPSFSRGATIGNSAAPNQSIIDKIPEGLQSQDTSVSRMLYTTPMGETGWYTGEVDFERNPHGQGRMRYKTGHSYEGQWIHGYGEVHLENLSRMRSGFGMNKAAWNQR